MPRGTTIFGQPNSVTTRAKGGLGIGLLILAPRHAVGHHQPLQRHEPVGAHRVAHGLLPPRIVELESHLAPIAVGSLEAGRQALGEPQRIGHVAPLHAGVEQQLVRRLVRDRSQEAVARLADDALLLRVELALDRGRLRTHGSGVERPPRERRLLLHAPRLDLQLGEGLLHSLVADGVEHDQAVDARAVVAGGPRPVHAVLRGGEAGIVALLAEQHRHQLVAQRGRLQAQHGAGALERAPRGLEQRCHLPRALDGRIGEQHVMLGLGGLHRRKQRARLTKHVAVGRHGVGLRAGREPRESEHEDG